MSTYLMAIFLVFSAMYLMVSTTSTNLKLKEAQVQEDYREAQNYEKGVKEVVTARNNFVKIYMRYPTSINELVSVGFLSTTFTASEYTKDVSIDSLGNIVVANRDIGNSLKNLLLESNKESLKTLKNVSNTEALLEQQKRFNTLKSNEKSITIGNNPTPSKDSADYVAPNLKGSTTNFLQGW